VVFTPAQPLGNGVYLAIATGYDAATGGTQSLVYTWNFTVQTRVLTTLSLTPESVDVYFPVPGSTNLTVTTLDQYGNPLSGVVVSVSATNGGRVPASVTTGSDGTATITVQYPTGATDDVTVIVTATSGSLSDSSTVNFIYVPAPPS